MKPRIDRTNLVTTTVKVGKQIFLDIDVAGEPAPGNWSQIPQKILVINCISLFLEIKWFSKDKELSSANNLSIENVPYNTKLKVVDGKRSDSGKYRIYAVNEHGSDEEYVELVFLGPPSRPMGKYKPVFVFKE